MNRCWTCYWSFRCWRPAINPEGLPLRSSGSDSFRKRGVSIGDTVYVVSLDAGQLYLGGRMVVHQIVSRQEAVRYLKNKNLYDTREWVIGPTKSGSSFHLHRRLSAGLMRQLRFESSSGPRAPRFVSKTRLDGQTLRGIRELTPASAVLLDRIILATDRLPRGRQLVTVTEGMLGSGELMVGQDEFRLPEEISPGADYTEGSVRRIEVNRYERDPQARADCIKAHRADCRICGFNFGASYGPEAEGYIHVHHLRPLSKLGAAYLVNPVEDLLPVCPNCHAVVHLGGRCRSIEEVRKLLVKRASTSRQ